VPDEQSMQPMQAMNDAEAYSARRQTRRTASSSTDAHHPLPLRSIAHVHREPTEVSATEATATAAGEGEERDDAVLQLSRALRAAERAHRAYLAELSLGDVEPAEDWSTWYAEYLLGLR
jgi:hypothetical protein